ncbi:hypothetical protein [Natrinema sp. HArc-T2]|uniref:DUF7475 family protein n=1 Tax=Natrinema sp. HArc-T2 TaxID=3242701 RepID=UPI00359DCB58
MGTTSTTGTASTFNRPNNSVGYIAIVMALITGVLHLVASTNAIQFSQVLGILFVLNGLGFLAGAVLYLTKYWKKELFLVAALYSLVTILALFAVQGWGVEAFYMQGSINPFAVITKAAEAVLVVCAIYLYAAE